MPLKTTAFGDDHAPSLVIVRAPGESFVVIDDGTRNAPLPELATAVKVLPEQLARLKGYMPSMKQAALAWDAGGTDEPKISVTDPDDARMLAEIVAVLYPGHVFTTT